MHDYDRLVHALGSPDADPRTLATLVPEARRRGDRAVLRRLAAAFADPARTVASPNPFAAAPPDGGFVAGLVAAVASQVSAKLSVVPYPYNTLVPRLEGDLGDAFRTAAEHIDALSAGSVLPELPIEVEAAIWHQLKYLREWVCGMWVERSGLETALRNLSAALVWEVSRSGQLVEATRPTVDVDSFRGLYVASRATVSPLSNDACDALATALLESTRALPSPEALATVAGLLPRAASLRGPALEVLSTAEPNQRPTGGATVRVPLPKDRTPSSG